MNSDNLKQQQPFFGEHTQFDGTKQLPSQNYPSHNFADPNIRPDAYQAYPGGLAHESVPIGPAGNAFNGTSGTQQIPSQNFPSHNFGDQNIRPDAYQANTSGIGHQSIPVGQAGNVPFGHVEDRKTEHVHLNPTERVNLAPDAEHVHITAGQAGSGNVEQVIRIKPDGQVQVTSEKVGEHHMEPLRKEHHVEPLRKEHHVEPLRKEHHVEPLRKEHHVEPVRKEHHVEKVKDVPTETTTVVKISEHEPGTAGYDRGDRGKHSKLNDDKHHGSHGKKDHGDKHHGIFGKKDHGDTHHVTEETKVKEHDDTHHGIFGKKDHSDTKDDTKVKVYKEYHGKSGKKKGLSKKHKGDKTDTTTVVKVSDNEHGTAGKHHHGTGATKVDKDIE